MDEQPALIALGRIIGVHGVRGWVKIHSDCRPREAVFDYGVFYARRSPASPVQELSLRDARIQGKGLIALFDGISSRDHAAALSGLTLYVPRSALPEPEDGGFYWADLFGLTVINREGKTLGTVQDIFETGANDVLVVRSALQEHLIPLIRGMYIDRVDFTQKQIYADWQAEWSAVRKEDIESGRAD